MMEKIQRRRIEIKKDKDGEYLLSVDLDTSRLIGTFQTEEEARKRGEEVLEENGFPIDEFYMRSSNVN